jgi:hypothetical protein
MREMKNAHGWKITGGNRTGGNVFSGHGATAEMLHELDAKCCTVKEAGGRKRAETWREHPSS